MSHPSQIARALHGVIEPVHAIMYFAPEVQQEWERLGLEPRGEGYVAGRAAPMGAVGAGAVAASFFGFNPQLISYAVPGAWTKAAPDVVLAARAKGIQALFERVGAPADGVEEATGLAVRAMAEVSTAGRPLAAANATVPLTGMPFADLWQATAVLREHRGDGHIAALLWHGLEPLAALAMYAAWQGQVSRRFLQASRLWDDDAWAVGESQLRDRGWMDADGALTADGRAARDDVEAATDRLAATPYAALGEKGARRLFELLMPIAETLNTAGAYKRPFPLPIDFATAAS